MSYCVINLLCSMEKLVTGNWAGPGNEAKFHYHTIQPITDLHEVSFESLPHSLVVWLPLQLHNILAVLCR